jgi:hypothetical protein
MNYQNKIVHSMNSLSIVTLVVIAAAVLWLVYNRIKNKRRSYMYYEEPVDLNIFPHSTVSSSASSTNQQYEAAATESNTGSWSDNDTAAATDSSELFTNISESADADADGGIGLDFSDNAADTD